MFSKENMIKGSKYAPGVINQEIHEVVSSILGEYHISSISMKNFRNNDTKSTFVS